MDNNMEIDTARSPEPHHLSPITDSGSIPTLDGWIESLMTCKQLSEDDVRRLCDRVGFPQFPRWGDVDEGSLCGMSNIDCLFVI